MLRLLTLGGAAVVNESGDDVSSSAAQRRTIALLSILAVAGPAGVSRERLVALLWPDAELDRGRHALTQALYASRRSLACDDLFAVDGDIKLRSERMTSDVGDLERLLAHDVEAAVSLFKGPFLDGFLLPGSAEFERWSAAQRTRIESRVVQALQRLARAANDPRRSLRWWKRAATIRPLDGSIAAQLMKALVDAGDRAGALQHAAIHAALLREELDLVPDRSVTDLVRSLRGPSTDGAPVDAARPAETTRVADAISDRAESDNQSPARRLSLRARARRPLAWISMIAAAVLMVATITTLSHLRATTAATTPFRNRIMVAPFRVAGADPSLSYLRDGIVELLTARLSGGARSTDAGAVLGAWRAAGISPAMEVPRDTVVQLASRFQASSVVVGGVVGAPRHIVIRATMLRVPTAAVVGQAIVEGPADSVANLVAQLAARLLDAETETVERIGSGAARVAISPAR